MSLPTRYSLGILLMGLLGLQFLPKINLGGRLKPDDLFFFFCVLVVLPFLKKMSRSLGLYLAVTLGILVLNLYNVVQGRVGAEGYLFSARYLAFCSMVLFGYLLIRPLDVNIIRRIWRVLAAFAVIQLLIIVAQRLGLLPGIYDNVIGDATARPTGLTSHPTELGFINLFLLTFAYQITHSSRRRGAFYVVIGALVVTLIAADSRTSLVGSVVLILCLELFARRERLRSRVLKWILVPLGVAVMSIGISQSDRIQQILDVRNLVFVISTLSEPRVVDFERINPELRPSGVDPSLYIRITKWSSVLSELARHPVTGAGPGAFGVAVDGLYVRLLGESGFLGTALYLFGLLVIFLSCRSFYFRAFMVIIVAVSVFIDALFFSRFAYVFYLYAGMNMNWKYRYLEQPVGRVRGSGA